MTMTPDEVVKVLNGQLRFWVSEKDAWKGIPGSQPEIEENIQALSSAILLIQDYQKLRERVSVEKVANQIAKFYTMRKAHTVEKMLAKQIVTYLQQPTEPIAR